MSVSNGLYLSWMGETGGAEIAMLRLAASLDRHKFSPHAWVLNRGPLEKALGGLEIPVKAFAVGRLRSLLFCPGFHSSLASYVRENSITWVHAVGTLAYLSGYAAVRRCGVPLIWWLVDMPEGRALPEKIAGILPADKIVCNSQATFRALCRHYPAQARKAAVVYPSLGESGPSRPERAEAVRQSLGLSRESKMVLCAARLQKWKGQEVLLKSAPAVLEKIPGAVFVFAGDKLPGMEENFGRELELLAQKLDIKARCLFLGRRDDVDALMEASDVVVHASTKPEPFGMVIPEAMRLGKAVIASSEGGPLEIVSHGENGWLVRPGDPALLSGALVRLLEDPALRRTLGEKAAASVERFYPGHIARAMEKIYDELAMKGKKS